MSKTIIVRSKTGVYHLASAGGPQRCNTRVGAFHTFHTDAKTVTAAPESAFCSKCFRAGKPTAERISEYFGEAHA